LLKVKSAEAIFWQAEISNGSTGIAVEPLKPKNRGKIQKAAFYGF